MPYSPQIISSSIGNAPPPAAVVKALNTFAKTKQLDANTQVGHCMQSCQPARPIALPPSPPLCSSYTFGLPSLSASPPNPPSPS